VSPPTFKKTSNSHDRSARNPLCRKRKAPNGVPAIDPNYVVQKYKTRASDEIILSYSGVQSGHDRTAIAEPATGMRVMGSAG
jgi:hypothetical protein